MSIKVNNPGLSGSEPAEAYLAALLAGETAAATRQVTTALTAGWSSMRIYQEIFTPGLRAVGDMWERGEVSVAEEHRAVQITLDEMARVRAHFEPAAATGKRILVATPPGELHWVGARMTADYFELNGIDVDFLGPDTPAISIVDYILHRGHHLAALSVTLPEAAHGAATVIRELRKRKCRVPVLVGGRAAVAATRWKKELGPFVIVEDPLQGFSGACRLLDLDRGQITFSTLLNRVGNRIETLRKSKHWNQQELADRTGLDRTYISALEGGKQNATMKVLLKIAEALEVPFDSLFSKD